MAVVFQDPEWEMGEVIIIITIVPRSASVDVFPLLGAVFLEECFHLSPAGISAPSKAVTPGAWVLEKCLCCGSGSRKAAQGRQACLALGIPGFSLSRHTEKTQKQKEAVHCRVLHCSFEGFSLLLGRPTKVHHFGKMEMCEEFGSYQASLLGPSYSVTIQTKLGFPKLADGARACFICEFWTQNHSLWQLQY